MKRPFHLGGGDGRHVPPELPRRALLTGAAGLAGAAILGACTDSGNEAADNGGQDADNGGEARWRPEFTMGLLTDRPVAGAGNAGQLYLATDEQGGTLFASTGESWVPAQACVDGS